MAGCLAARVGDFNQLGEDKQDDDSISVIARARNHLQANYRSVAFHFEIQP